MVAPNWAADVSGGLNFSGSLWGRENDNIGMGYACLTGDIQYMKDTVKTGESPTGWIYGPQVTAEF